MRDYANLVKALRVCGSAPYDCSDCPIESDECNGVMSLFSKAADAIEELLAAVPHWISVEDALPEKNANYLTYGVFLPLGVKAMDMFRFDGDHWMVSKDVKITHWMPLPAPPKEVE